MKLYTGMPTKAARIAFMLATAAHFRAAGNYAAALRALATLKMWRDEAILFGHAA